ncbi:MAG: glycosyltransferase family 39 protein [Candidatus Moranbacteria bacterium]|nr:glycosyltransferase family 39 protein [Candidatus Moranbacteria bacterium]
MMTIVNFFRDWKKVLVAVVLVGAFLRFFALGATSFVADEFLDINASYGYFKTGEWQAWDFDFERPDTAENANIARDERAFAYKWQVAQLFRILPPTEATARSVSALWGVVTVLLVFYMTVSFTKRKEIGLIAAFLYAVSISALVMDRRLRMYAMFVSVFLTFSWMTYRVLEERYQGKIRWLRAMQKRFGLNLAYVIPAIVLGLLSLHLHLLTANIVFIVLFYAIVQAILSVRTSGWQFNKYLCIIIGFAAGVIGLQLFASEAYALLASSFSFPDNHYGYFEIVLKDYSQPLLAMIFLAAGVGYMIRQEKFTKEGLWLALSFLTPLFMAVFMWRRNVGEQYISFAQPFKIMLVAIGVYAVARFFEKHMPGFGKKTFAAALVLSLFLLPNYGYFFQSDNTYAQTSQSDNPQYKKVFGYFMKNRSVEDILITRDLRSYYVSGAHAHIENIGGEATKDKLTLERLQGILAQYPHGWIILSDNDDTFVSHDAMKLIEKTMERVSNPAVRGQVSVYRF